MDTEQKHLFHWLYTRYRKNNWWGLDEMINRQVEETERNQKKGDYIAKKYSRSTIIAMMRRDHYDIARGLAERFFKSVEDEDKEEENYLLQDLTFGDFLQDLKKYYKDKTFI